MIKGNDDIDKTTFLTDALENMSTKTDIIKDLETKLAPKFKFDLALADKIQAWNASTDKLKEDSIKFEAIKPGLVYGLLYNLTTQEYLRPNQLNMLPKEKHTIFETLKTMGEAMTQTCGTHLQGLFNKLFAKLLFRETIFEPIIEDQAQEFIAAVDAIKPVDELDSTSPSQSRANTMQEYTEELSPIQNSIQHIEDSIQKALLGI